MFGKRYLFSILVAFGLVAAGIVLAGQSGYGTFTATGAALLSVLPVFWYESRTRNSESQAEIRETYATLKTELTLNKQAIEDPPFTIDDVLAAELQTSAWENLLGSGRIVKVPEEVRNLLLKLYREVKAVNQFTEMFRRLYTSRPASYVTVAGPNPGQRASYPDPDFMNNLKTAISAKTTAILNFTNTIIEKWNTDS